MNDTATNPAAAGIQFMPASIISELWHAKRLIIINFVVVSFLAAGFSLLLPVWYKSSATVLPPSAGGGEILIGGVGAANPLSALGFGGASEEINNYITILKSRRLREIIIREFNLMEKYKTKTIESALERLDSKIDLEVTDEGALMFSILDRDSLQAKLMADAILRELGATTISLGTRTGQRNRRFIHSRIVSVKEELAGVEQAMLDFTARYGTFDLPTQLATVVEQIIQMEIALADAEIEYDIASASLNEKHPQLEFLRIQRDKIKAKVEDLMAGKGKSNLLPNLKELPEVTVEYARLIRDIEILSALLEFLYPQYEQARLQEAKDEPTLLALDYPRVPQKKDKPKRAVVVLTCGLFSLLISSVWVVVRPQLQLTKPRERQDSMI
ncbi:hypothetical protein ES703_18069 [subsurface metagenome]|nr:hypothetical protein [Dehalococcoidia bacterium]